MQVALSLPMNCRGSSLLEALVAWFIMTTVLVGCVQYQIISLRQTESAFYQSIATIQLAAMIERLRVNQDAGARATELSIWNQDNTALLPQGQGDFNCNINTPLCNVILHWEWHGHQQFVLQGLIE